MSGVAYSYLRFSSKPQERGDSLRRQTASTEEWCKRNGIQLDRSVFIDPATSAWTGEHRKNPDRHALAAFLKMIEPGPQRRIPEGSYLVVETLCRLTRQDIQQALILVLGILQAGIKLVQLRPYEVVFDSESDARDIMLMSGQLMTANEESEKKSHMVGAAWAQKRLLAREQKKPMTPTCPNWLKLANGEWVADKKRAAIIVYIFELAAAGLGSLRIAKRLTEEKIDPFVRSGRWSSSSVWCLLRNRAVLGEFQPCTKRKGDRRADGEPILDFYPRIVEDSLFWAAIAGIDKRRRHRGRIGMRVNVFSGLLHDAVGGGMYYSILRRDKPGVYTRQLVNRDSREGQSKARIFLFDVFEEALIGQWLLIKPEELEPLSDKAEAIAVMLAEKEAKEKQLAKIEKQLETEDVATLGRVAGKLEKQIAALEAAIAEARRESVGSSVEDWIDAQRFFKDFKSGTEEEQLAKGLGLRSILRRVIEEIWLIVTGIPGKSDRYCIAQVFFRNSPLSRVYIIWNRGAARFRERESAVGRWPEAESQNVNLRDPEQAREILERLLSSPPEMSSASTPPKRGRRERRR